MAMDAVDDINIENQEKLITPFSLKGRSPSLISLERLLARVGEI